MIATLKTRVVSVRPPALALVTDYRKSLRYALRICRLDGGKSVPHCARFAARRSLCGFSAGMNVRLSTAPCSAASSANRSCWLCHSQRQIQTKCCKILTWSLPCMTYITLAEGYLPRPCTKAWHACAEWSRLFDAVGPVADRTPASGQQIVCQHSWQGGMCSFATPVHPARCAAAPTANA